MASLVIKFADLASEPVGSGRDVTAEVLVSYTREVPLTDGTVLQAVPTRKQLGAGGTAIFEVTPSDDPTVQEAHKHFGLRVEWLLTHRAGRGRQTETRGARTVKVTAADGATVQFGRLVPSEPVPAEFTSLADLLSMVEEGAFIEGPQGPIGPEGPEGPVGPKGDTGDQGIQGIPGADGGSDTGVAALVTDTGSATAAALDAMQPHVSAALYGMSTTNTGTQNKTALLAAIAAGGNRAVFIPAGTYNLDPITDTDFGSHAARLVGVGSKVLAGKRWVVGSASWDTDGPTGTVLRCSTTLAAGEPFIHIGSTDSSTSTSLHDIALLGQGAGTGLKAGQDVGSTGGGYPLRWDFQGLTIANFDIGMTHTGENGVLIAPYIVGCGDGFYAGYPWNGNTVIGINVERISRSAIRLDHAITNVFMGGVLQASYPQLATILVENSSLGNVFEGLYCENYAPTTGPHAGVLHEVWEGRPGSGGGCYGNKYRNMHWGSQTASTPESKIVIHNSYFAEVTMDHSASGTLQPSVELNGGWGHEVSGLFPSITGAAASKSRVRNTTGAAGALDVTETYGWNLATEGFLRVGNAVTSAMPDPVKAGVGAIHRDEQHGTLMDSDGSGWAPIASRFVPFSSGAGGSLDGSTGTGLTWLRYTHLKFTGPSGVGFKLWPTSSATRGRAYFIRNGKATGDYTISVQSGETLDGATNGTVTLAAGQGMWFTVSAATSAWVSA